MHSPPRSFFQFQKSHEKREREREKGAGTKTNARASPLTCIFLGRCIFFLSSFCRTTNWRRRRRKRRLSKTTGNSEKDGKKWKSTGDKLNISPSLYTSPAKGRFRTALFFCVFVPSSLLFFQSLLFLGFWGGGLKKYFCYPKLYMNCLGFAEFGISLWNEFLLVKFLDSFVTRATFVVAFVRGGPSRERKRRRRRYY